MAIRAWPVKRSLLRSSTLRSTAGAAALLLIAVLAQPYVVDGEFGTRVEAAQLQLVGRAGVGVGDPAAPLGAGGEVQA
jgi:hypothetical protein